MNVDEIYVDLTALRQLYVHDAHSAAMAARRFKNPGLIDLTRFGRPTTNGRRSLLNPAA
jgi:hypothetical protein